MGETSDFKAKPPAGIDRDRRLERRGVRLRAHPRRHHRGPPEAERAPGRRRSRPAPRHLDQPGREALQLLRGEGFVIFTPNRGARVRPIDQDFVRDIYEIGVLIEPALTRWFVGMATRRGHRRARAHPGPHRGEQLCRSVQAQRTRHGVPHGDVPAPLQPPRRRALVEASRGAARREPPLQFHAGASGRSDARSSRTDRAHQGAAMPTRPPRLVARHVEGSGRHILEQMRALNAARAG